ncbi:hypothetical protein Q1695_003103 [Nippostrongylus brasiliensis]|nr:hypothetical protein Q1695_003103 [Nippostrongylus brasiliensis]
MCSTAVNQYSFEQTLKMRGMLLLAITAILILAVECKWGDLSCAWSTFFCRRVICRNCGPWSDCKNGFCVCIGCP